MTATIDIRLAIRRLTNKGVDTTPANIARFLRLDVEVVEARMMALMRRGELKVRPTEEFIPIKARLAPGDYVLPPCDVEYSQTTGLPRHRRTGDG